jgi:hypothetical protein
MASQTGKTKTQLDWQNRNINEVVETQPVKDLTRDMIERGSNVLDQKQAEVTEKEEEGQFHSTDRWLKRTIPGYRFGKGLYDMSFGGKKPTDVIGQNVKETGQDVMAGLKNIATIANPVLALGAMAIKNQIKEDKVPDSEDIEMEEMEKLRAANTADLKEMPGKAGEAAHKNLHKTVDAVVSKMEKMHPEQLKEDPTDILSQIGQMGMYGAGGAALYSLAQTLLQRKTKFKDKPTSYEVMKDLVDSGQIAQPGEPQTMPGIPLTPEQQDAIQQQMAAREILRDQASRAIAAATSEDSAQRAARAARIQAKKETAGSVNPRPPKPPPCPGCGR